MKIKDLSIKLKLFISTALVNLFVIIVIFLVVLSNVNKLATNNAKDIAFNVAGKWGNFAKSYIESPLLEARSLAKLLEGELNSNTTNNLTREQVNAMLRNLILESPEYLGSYVAFEPNAFDGKDSVYQNTEGHDNTGRFVPYWTKGEGNGLLEALVSYDVEGDGDYYQIPKKTRRESILEPYEYKIGGEDVILTSLVIPLTINDQFAGIAGIDISLDDIVKKFDEISFYDKGYVSLYTENGTLLATKNVEDIRKNVVEITDNNDFIKGVKNQREFTTHFTSQSDNEFIAIGVPIEIGNTGTKWSIVAFIPEEELLSEMGKLTFLIFLLGIIAIIIISIIIWFIANYITKQISNGIEFVEKVASGDLTVEMQIDNKDEIGLMSEAVAKMVKRLRTVVQDIREGASNVAKASEQISSSTQHLSQSTTEQASSVEEVSATMEQMTANIAQNTNNAIETNKISLSAQKGIEEVSNYSTKSIDASNTIADKIMIINEIAFQTNILALNAAVEAARAGEMGKGFAVVASEVRKLAERSKIAADEIVSLTENTVNNTHKAGDLLHKTLPEIEHSVKLIMEITSASKEQKNGTMQVSNSVQQLNEITQQNAASAEEIASGAEELNVQAKALEQLVSYFKTGDKTSGKFISNTFESDASPKTFTQGNTVKEDNTKTKSKITKSNNVKSFTLDMSPESDNDFEKY